MRSFVVVKAPAQRRGGAVSARRLGWSCASWPVAGATRRRGRPPVSDPRGPEPALAALARGEGVGLHGLEQLDPRDHELRDPVPGEISNASVRSVLSSSTCSSPR